MLVAMLTLVKPVTSAELRRDDVIEFESNELTCWTCPNKTDNEACNDWAPDVSCPQNHTVCMTVHRLVWRQGRSVAVNKVCARQHECTLGSVGCFRTDTPGIVECVSCCDTPYCNENVPTNHSTASALSSLTAPVIASGATSTHSLYSSVTLSLTTLMWTILSNASLGSTKTIFCPSLSISHRTTKWRLK